MIYREADTPDRTLQSLSRFVRRRVPAETCELCRQGIAAQHEHLFQVMNRRLFCVCAPCALLFSGQAETSYKRVPQRVKLLHGFHLTDAMWDSMMIPIGITFFCRDGRNGKIAAFYPGPAGATESLLAMDVWESVAAQNPSLAEMRDDVEALLVNRLGRTRGQSPPEYYLLPIDECFRLVGMIRTRWKGLSGGAEVWQEISEFFAQMKNRAALCAESVHA